MTDENVMSYIYVLENIELYTSTCSWVYKLSNGVFWSIICNLKFKLWLFEKGVSHLIGVNCVIFPAISSTYLYYANFLKIIQNFQYTHGSNPFFIYKSLRLFIVFKNKKGKVSFEYEISKYFSHENYNGRMP